MPSTQSHASTDLESLLEDLDAADAAVRALYLKLADNPDLATEYDAGLREIHAKRADLARRVGKAALAERRASRAASAANASTAAPDEVAEPSVDSPVVAEDDASSPALSSDEVSSPVAAAIPTATPTLPVRSPVVPVAPVSAQQLAEFIVGLSAPASSPRAASRPDDRTVLLALAGHVSIAEKVTTTAAFEPEVEQIERATSEDRQKRWREMTREGQVRWLSVMVAWAKALEQDALRFREATLAERAAQGSVDFILVTRFVAHKETQAIERSTKTPILTMRHGYGVTTVRQVLEEWFARVDEKHSVSAFRAR